MFQSQKPPTEALRAAVVAEAESWLLTPYHHRARLKGVGVDCAQILIGVYAAVGLVEPFDAGDYPMDWMLHRDEERYLAWVEQYAHEVAAPQPGDIAVWRFGRTFSHGAIVIGWPNIIHAYRPDRMVARGDASQVALAGREVKFYSLFED
jgi:NlpC/P60 family putative phage cell wall peptidase